MRVLLAAQFYPPDIGGEERHVRNLGMVLKARGHEVEVVTTALPSTGAGTSVEDGIPVHRIVTTAQRLPLLHGNADRPHMTPFPDVAMRHAIEKLLRELPFDVVHAHNWIVNSALEPTTSQKVPLVLTLHDYSHVCVTKRLVRDGAPCTGPGATKCLVCASHYYGLAIGPPTVIVNAVSARARRRHIAYFIAVSNAVARENLLERAGLSYEVIPNFIPDSLVVPTPPSPDGPIVFVGDLAAQKGVRVLLDAYERLVTKPGLLLVGRSGDDLGELPSGAKIVGPLPHEQVMPLMASAQLVVVPSIMPDPCPTVVLEAMAHARPVVASANGGIVDMVTSGESGLLVRPGDPVALASAMSTIIADKLLGATMGRVALARVHEFTASAVIDRIESVYSRTARRAAA